MTRCAGSRGRSSRRTSPPAATAPAWTWLGIDGRRIVARAVWWGRGGVPLALDCLWADPAAGDPALLAERVLVAGPRLAARRGPHAPAAVRAARAAGVARARRRRARRRVAATGVRRRRPHARARAPAVALGRRTARGAGAAGPPALRARGRRPPSSTPSGASRAGSLDVTTRRAVDDLRPRGGGRPSSSRSTARRPASARGGGWPATPTAARRVRDPVGDRARAERRLPRRRARGPRPWPGRRPAGLRDAPPRGVAERAPSRRPPTRPTSRWPRRSPVPATPSSRCAWFSRRRVAV